MSLDNRIKAFELLQETLFAFEDMSSDKRWLTVDNFKRLRGEVLKIMEKGLDCQSDGNNRELFETITANGNRFLHELLASGIMEEELDDGEEEPCNHI